MNLRKKLFELGYEVYADDKTEEYGEWVITLTKKNPATEVNGVGKTKEEAFEQAFKNLELSD